MTLKDIWDIIHHNPSFYPVIIILILSLIEVSKIKLNPWTAIGKIIGRFLGIESISKKVDALEKKIGVLDQKVEENDIVTARVRILRFASEIQDYMFHNKDSWDQTMIDIEKYEQYVMEHPTFKNGITEPTIEYIKEQYKERLEKRDWDRKK